jgi:hypothetical protein
LDDVVGEGAISGGPLKGGHVTQETRVQNALGDTVGGGWQALKGGDVPTDPRDRGEQGRAVQVHPIKPTLKAPGTKRLKLKYVELLSNLLKFCLNFAFKFKLRR